MTDRSAAVHGLLEHASDTDAKDGGGLVLQTVRAINQHIREMKLRTGDPIPGEVTFAEKLKVSRAVVREAFRSLATLGIIVIGSGRRARVGGIDQWVLPAILDHAVFTDQVSLAQIFDVRRTLETRVAALAAIRRGDDDAAEIIRLAARMRAGRDNPSEIMVSDIAFHEAIAHASKSSLYALMVTGFHFVSQQTIRISWSNRTSTEEFERAIVCHERIASAIAAQNSRDAELAMTQHFDNAITSMLRAGVF
jgi:DNA-binding FadR family transcriptional regulator